MSEQRITPQESIGPQIRRSQSEIRGELRIELSHEDMKPRNGRWGGDPTP